MKKPHKWQKEIIAWASGSEIQFKSTWNDDDWQDCGDDPDWNETEEECYFRVKPKNDLVLYFAMTGVDLWGKNIMKGGTIPWIDEQANTINQLKLTVDPETNRIKTAEIIG